MVSKRLSFENQATNKDSKRYKRQVFGESTDVPIVENIGVYSQVGKIKSNNVDKTVKRRRPT